jgi:hypothetical protein
VYDLLKVACARVGSCRDGYTFGSGASDLDQRRGPGSREVANGNLIERWETVESSVSDLRRTHGPYRNSVQDQRRQRR